MFNTTKRVLALVLVAVLVFSLAGCSKVEDNGSSADVEVQYVTEYQTASGDSTSTGNSSGGGNTPSGNKNPDGNTPTTSSGSSDEWVVNQLTQADLDALKGTTVKFASTIDPKSDGTQNVVDSFTKKYGINVEIVACSLPGYITEMQGLINADEAPDVGRSNGDYPGFLAYFDSLDKAKIDFNDPIWNQNTFKLSTFNGKTYMCDTYGNYWTEVDIIAYNKKILNDAGIKTPEEYAATGDWTWDAFFEICREATDFMGKPAGTACANEAALHAAGGAVFRIENERMVNAIDANTTAIINKFAKANKDGIYQVKGSTAMVDGTAAISILHAWALRKDGDLKNSQWGNMGFYFLPSYEKGGETPATGIFRGFGIMKGAKNPLGGGVFLRHYLDVENYDTDNAFLSEEAKTFFFRLTTKDYADNYNPYLTYVGLNKDIAGVDYDKDIYAVLQMEPGAVVDSQMAAVKSAVEKGAKNLNDFIEDNVYSN